MLFSEIDDEFNVQSMSRVVSVTMLTMQSYAEHAHIGQRTHHRHQRNTVVGAYVKI